MLIDYVSIVGVTLKGSPLSLHYSSSDDSASSSPFVVLIHVYSFGLGSVISVIISEAYMLVCVTIIMVHDSDHAFYHSASTRFPLYPDIKIVPRRVSFDICVHEGLVHG